MTEAHKDRVAKQKANIRDKKRRETRAAERETTKLQRERELNDYISELEYPIHHYKALSIVVELAKLYGEKRHTITDVNERIKA